jgi:aryl-alcohol dehydrogenase-like predicted oxidoreductase
MLTKDRAVSVVIPGAKNPKHARMNVDAAAFAPSSPDTMARIRSVYETRPMVHQRW